MSRPDAEFALVALGAFAVLYALVYTLMGLCAKWVRRNDTQK